MMRRIITLALAALFSGGCIGMMNAPRTPTQDYSRGDLRYTETFDRDAETRWLNYDLEGLRAQVRDGAYHAELERSFYMSSLNMQTHSNVVLEVSTMLLSAGGTNGFGLMCRSDASNNGDGYYFLISGDGAYSIRRGRDNDVEALVAWERSDAIRTGTSPNTVRAVCIDDYLALYVNGQFVAEARDTLYQRGAAGVAFVTADDEPLHVTFDNLTAHDAARIDTAQP